MAALPALCGSSRCVLNTAVLGAATRCPDGAWTLASAPGSMLRQAWPGLHARVSWERDKDHGLQACRHPRGVSLGWGREAQGCLVLQLGLRRSWCGGGLGTTPLLDFVGGASQD